MLSLDTLINTLLHILHPNMFYYIKGMPRFQILKVDGNKACLPQITIVKATQYYKEKR